MVLGVIIKLRKNSLAYASVSRKYKKGRLDFPKMIKKWKSCEWRDRLWQTQNTCILFITLNFNKPKNCMAKVWISESWPQSFWLSKCWGSMWEPAFFFYWRIIALQCWVSCCYTRAWISYMDTHIPSLLSLPHPLLPNPTPLWIITEHRVEVSL